MVCKPGSTKVHTSFEGEVYCLTKEEGGRHTAFTTNYRPQFYFRTADLTGTGRSGRTGGGSLRALLRCTGMYRQVQAGRVEQAGAA